MCSTRICPYAQGISEAGGFYSNSYMVSDVGLTRMPLMPLYYAWGLTVFGADSLPELNILNLTNEYFADKEIMAVQGRTTSINERNSVLTRIIATEEKAWFQMLLSGRERLKLFVPLNGTCQFVRCSVFEKIGGWDENSLTEDVEYALRLVEQGGMLSMLLMCVQVRKHPQLYIV